VITRSMRQAMRHEEGQALVLACIAVLIISLAVITTVNLGQGIHERQRLQNTADAAAYSMAAMEARAFNFYAFVNRTHASHYVSAMVWQSLLSFTYFTEAFLVDLYGVMKTLDPCAGSTSALMTAFCDVLKALPIIGNIINFIGQVIGFFRQMLKSVFLYMMRTIDPDRIVGRWIIPIYRVMNSLLTGAAKATLAATLTQVTSTSNDVVLENDRNVDLTASRLAAGMLSACMLSRVNMKEAWAGDPFTPLEPSEHLDSSKIARAKRSMGDVSNATRFALDRQNNGPSLAGPGWVTSRKLDDLIQFPTYLKPLKQLLDSLPDWKWGQTKMLSWSDKAPRGRNTGTRTLAQGGNHIRDWEDPPDAPDGMLAQGDDLGSDDVYDLHIGPAKIGLGPFNVKNPLSCVSTDDPADCWGDPRRGLNDDARAKLPFRYLMETSIWALTDGPSIHWRLVSMPNGRLFPNAPGAQPPQGYPNNPEAELGLNKIKKDLVSAPLGVGPSLSLTIWTANVLGVQDGNHPWDGVAPFPHFEPGQYDRECGLSPAATGTPSLTEAAPREEEFNQPSSFALLQKKNGGDPVKPALLNDKGEVNFHFTQAGARLVLSNTRKTFMGGTGLNVISRAQTYYHRPGNWHEQPNFFNPYWKPRLASVWQGRYAMPLVADFGSMLPGPLAGLPQKVITH
jgi:hypothetical protein